MTINNNRNLIKLNIYFIRHAETDFNKSGIIQGQLNTKLSSTGVKQAKLLAKHLQNTHFHYVFSSDLDRAHQTAIEIVNWNNNKDKIKFLSDELLRERNFGEAQGKHKDYLLNMAKKHNLSIREYVPFGGESYEEVRNRWRLFFKNLFSLISEEKLFIENNPISDVNFSNNSKNLSYEILIVSHGAALKEIYKLLVYELKCKFPFDYQELEKSAKNTSISNFTFEINKEHCINDNLVNFINDNLQSWHHVRIECNYFHRYEHLYDNNDNENSTVCDL